MRRQVGGMIAALVVASSGVAAQTSTPGTVPLIEREPPLATKPFAPAPILVPQTNGVPMPVSPPPMPAPVVVPHGPAPVVVTPTPEPGPVFTPATPPVQGSSAPPTPPAPAAEPAKPAAPAPSEAKSPEAPPAPPAAAEPAAPPVSAQPVPPAPAAAPSAPPAASPAPPVEPPAPPAAPSGETVVPVPPPPVSTPPSSAAPSSAAPSSAAPAPAVPAPTEFQVEEMVVAPRPALFVTGVTTWEKAEEQLGGVFAKLGDAAAKLGIEKHGGPLVEYIESDSDDVGYRVLLPVDTLPKGKLPKGVKTGQTPAGKALRFRHDGPIEDLEEVYGRIDDEVTKRGVDVRAIVEQYDEDALGSPEDRVVVDVWVFLK